MAEKITTRNRFSDFDIAFTRVGNEQPYALGIKSDQNSIVQAIKNLVLTSPGEKPFLPSFGGGVTNFLFENISPETVSELSRNIEYALKLYEPRVVFDSLEINESKMDSNNVFIDLKYQLVGEPTGTQTRSATIELVRAI